MAESYLVIKKWFCKDKLKGKTIHFRLPSVSQKCPVLSLPISRDGVLRSVKALRAHNQILKINQIK